MQATEYLHSLQQVGLTLSPVQAEAVAFKKGPLLVIAGPGSGKTRVITARVGALIAGGINPSHITVVTFTRAAANEMKRRIAELPHVGEGLARRLNIGTFHGQFLRALRRFGFSGPIVTEEEKRRSITTALRKLGEDVKDDLLESLQNEISWHKNNLLHQSDVTKDKELLCDVWRIYEEYKLETGALDFDDMLCETHRLLTENSQALNEMRQAARYLLVDEFQDTNLAQFEVLRLIAEPENNVCVVGDVDQAIYSWRAARPEFLLRFTTHYPQAHKVALQSNYRSTPQIINLANRVISNNKLRHDISISPVRGGGTAPIILTPASERAEAKSVLTMVKKQRDNGTPFEEMAVFYRINKYNHHLVNLLVEEGLPFVVRDKERFFEEHWVIRECLAFLKLVIDRNDTDSFLAVGRRQLELSEEQSTALKKSNSIWPAALVLVPKDKLDKLKAHLQMAAGMSPSEALEYYLTQMGYGQYLRWYAKRRGLAEREFINMCEELEQEVEDYPNISNYLEHTKKLERAMAQARREEAVPGALNLMTLHAAKGLEFGAVYIIGAFDGLMPHKAAESPEELEEERRLFYVGCTRAKDKLTVFAPQKYRGKQTVQSCFINEGFGKQEATKVQARPVPKPQFQNKKWPAPVVGMTVQHNTRGFGKVAEVTSEHDVGGIVHFVSVEFASSRHKIHWQIALSMGTLTIDDS